LPKWKHKSHHNFRRAMPLECALMWYPGIAQLMLDRKVNVTRNVMMDTKSKGRNVSCLHIALDYKRYDLLEQMVDLGADVTSLNNCGENAFFRVSQLQTEYPVLFTKMINAGANVNSIGHDKRSVLLSSVINSFNHYVTILLDNDVDVDQQWHYSYWSEEGKYVDRRENVLLAICERRLDIPLDVITKIIQKTNQINHRLIKTLDKGSAIYYASRNRMMNVVDLILDKDGVDTTEVFEHFLKRSDQLVCRSIASYDRGGKGSFFTDHKYPEEVQSKVRSFIKKYVIDNVLLDKETDMSKSFQSYGDTNVLDLIFNYFL
jgi:hypothetical protein